MDTLNIEENKEELEKIQTLIQFYKKNPSNINFIDDSESVFINYLKLFFGSDSNGNNSHFVGILC